MMAPLPWFWRSDLDPHPCVVSTIPTGLSPRPRNDHLELTKDSTEFNSLHAYSHSSIQDVPGYKCGTSHVCSLASALEDGGMVLKASSLLSHNGTKDADFSYKLKHTLLE